MIKVAGLDMTMSSLGAVRFALEPFKGRLVLEEAFSLKTERGDRKLIRSNSDDLRRAREIAAGMLRITAGCAFVCAEVPSGAQSARASLSFGITIGLLATLSPPLIQVMPDETKIASVGSKKGTKPQIIAWAAALYPEAPWERYTRDVYGKGVKSSELLHKEGDLHDNNEHMADACAVVHAGLQTDEFARLKLAFTSVA